jgi:hypothetical protein
MKIGSAVQSLSEPEKIIALKKMKNKTDKTVIFTYALGGTPIVGMMKLGSLVELSDVISLAKFNLNWMDDMCACSGSNKGFLRAKCK